MSALSRKRPRSRSDEGQTGAPNSLPEPAKKPRLERADNLSALSDELLVRVLRCLSISQLVNCQQVSRRFYRLGGDSQLWKAFYYDRFVRPRALRLPGTRQPGALDATSKSAVWMNEQHLVSAGPATNWLRQYKLRHNWSRGDCQVREVRLAERTPTPRTLIQVHESTALTAGREQGLRSWRIDGTTAELACAHQWDEIRGDEMVPSAMAVSAYPEKDTEFLAFVGFSQGNLDLFAIGDSGATIRRVVGLELPEKHGITAVASSYPYLAVLTSTNVLFLYSYGGEALAAKRPHLMASLRSSSVWPPASLAMRLGQDIHVSIAYALPQYLSGWSVGLQEMCFSRDGTLKRARTATAADQTFTALNSASVISAGRESGSASPSRPTALSLSHPYILTAHPDNTLTLYMVRTTDADLGIGRGRKLWGHTSSVSAVHVGSRGKAVSVGVNGSEIRVWDLEGGDRHAHAQDARARPSVRIRAKIASVKPRLRTSDFADGIVGASTGISQDAWVGFDDERLLVLREVDGGSEALVIHDFS